jgi:3'-5' exoribonuclease
VVRELAESRLWVCDIINKGQEVNEVYAIRRKETPRKGKKAGFFFSMVVSDATGDIKVNFWGKDDEALVRRTFDSVREGTMVRVIGMSDLFGEEVVIQVNGGLLDHAHPEDFNPADFVPATEKDPEEMFAELQACIQEIKEPHIKALMESLFSDPSLVRDFKTAPASVSYHCAWVGGLLEHTLNVLRTCDFISKLYTELDRDLLLSSAILHDIGKIRCYDVSTTITESVDGRLKGHLVIGAQMVEEACSRLPSFPGPLRTKLVHMVLASHGSNEKGSPTEPSIPEALALNFADEMDAKLERFIRARGNGGPEDVFVMDHQLGTKVYLG